MIRFFLSTVTVLCLFNGAQAADKEQPTVLVSIAPYRYLVEQLTDQVHVEVMVPPGADLHTFEPTPRQMMQASQAKLWLRIGEGFEDRLLEVLRSYNPSLSVVDLRAKVDLIHDHEGHQHCSHDCVDPHIWLSPKQVRIQVESIAAALLELLPQQTGTIVGNLQTLLKQLDALDRETAGLLKKARPKQVLVSHPAYGYLCRDYGLTQLSIEQHGKEPTPRQIDHIIQQARKWKLARVFLVGQFSRKAAEVIAAELDAELVQLDPYLEEYPELIRRTAQGFAGK